jgi:hypothetical protein
MSSSPVRRLVVTAGLALPALLVPALPALASPAAPPVPVLEVVTEGLDNPRGLTIGKDGTVYVVEGGRGGDDCRDLPPQGGHAGGDLCFGLTGSVTRVSDGVEVVPALPSFAGREGFFALGPNDVTTVGSGKFQVTISGGPLDVDTSALELRPEFSPLLGTVVRVRGGGDADRTRIVADFLAYEDARNVDGDVNNDGSPNIESNPYGILDNPGFFGGLFGATTDAAANTLLRYGPFGYIETLAVFPTREVPNPFPGGSPTVNAQSVPTSVVIGPDGAYYVGELTGFPWAPGTARIWRVPRFGGEPQVYRDGLTTVIDLTFDRHGNLYVLQVQDEGLLSNNLTGSLLRFAPGADEPEVIASEGLVSPTSVAVADEGTIYVSNFGYFPSDGQVVKIAPPA